MKESRFYVYDTEGMVRQYGWVSTWTYAILDKERNDRAVCYCDDLDTAEGISGALNLANDGIVAAEEGEENEWSDLIREFAPHIRIKLTPELLKKQHRSLYNVNGNLKWNTSQGGKQGSPFDPDAGWHDALPICGSMGAVDPSPSKVKDEWRMVPMKEVCGRAGCKSELHKDGEDRTGHDEDGGDNSFCHPYEPTWK